MNKNYSVTDKFGLIPGIDLVKFNDYEIEKLLKYLKELTEEHHLDILFSVESKFQSIILKKNYEDFGGSIILFEKGQIWEQSLLTLELWTIIFCLNKVKNSGILDPKHFEEIEFNWKIQYESFFIFLIAHKSMTNVKSWLWKDKQILTLLRYDKYFINYVVEIMDNKDDPDPIWKYEYFHIIRDFLPIEYQNRITIYETMET